MRPPDYPMNGECTQAPGPDSIRHYGNPAYWRLLAQADQIDNPLRLPPNRPLVIPPKSASADRMNEPTFGMPQIRIEVNGSLLPELVITILSAVHVQQRLGLPAQIELTFSDVGKFRACNNSSAGQRAASDRWALHRGIVSR